jgi:DNA-binding beta-propeller fold protein YncE
MGRRAILPRVLFLLGLAALGVAIFLFFNRLSRQAAPPQERDLGANRAVPPELLGYDFLTRIPAFFENPLGLALDRYGTLLVAGEGGLAVVHPKAFSLVVLKGTARCVAVAPDGEIHLGVGDHVKVFNEKGRHVRDFGSLGPRAVITSVAAGAKDVYIADAGQRRVWRFDRSGVLGEIIEGGEGGFVVPSPYFDVLLDGRDGMWVANTGEHRVEHFSREGRLLSSWGGFSMAWEGFCGCCNPSHMARMPGGGFVTSEKGIPRVKVYDPEGRFLTVVAGPESFAPNARGLDLVVDRDGKIYVLHPARKEVLVFRAGKERQ